MSISSNDLMLSSTSVEKVNERTAKNEPLLDPPQEMCTFCIVFREGLFYDLLVLMHAAVSES